ncbi:MAG: hypothetical protein QOI66_2348 [Myxococcales bacterium]|jgi:lysophospholipase L1-like esterase|nr:hypothetical protein [Myxococcales bacterium]
MSKLTAASLAFLAAGVSCLGGCGDSGEAGPASDGGGSGGAETDGGSSDGGGTTGSGSGGSTNIPDASTDAGTDMIVSDGGPTGAPAVRFVGRFDRSDPNNPRFAWSGSGMIARFAGTSVGVKLGGGQQFTVLVDGALRPKLIPLAGGALSPIASGLPAGEHLVEIYRRTEGNQGESQFLGFDFGGGALLAPPPTPARRIEIIGDSITCGYGVEGADMNCHYTPDTQNHYLTYGAITARNLNADLVTLAWSGKGIVCNYGDDPTSCVDPFPIYYDRTLPDRAASQWDFASWQPQVVVINLGTNDVSTPVDPTEAQFTGAYRTFLQHVRSKYPAALILCTVAPLLGGADLTEARAYIDAAVAATGDAKIKSFPMAQTDPADGWGCDFHPSVKTHQKMAATLTAQLKTELGW